MNSWQFITQHNKTNEKYTHENPQQQNNKNKFYFHLFTTPTPSDRIGFRAWDGSVLARARVQ